MAKHHHHAHGAERVDSAAATPWTAAADRIAAGKALHEKVPRAEHGAWKPDADRADPLDILRAADATRVAHLVPLRYGRMLQSPFTFYRGSAGAMAADLSRTPSTGVHVQICGDAHLLNFGGFATPERRLLFDVNDLDERCRRPGNGMSSVSSPRSCWPRDPMG